MPVLLSLIIGSLIALRLLVFQGHTIQQGRDRSLQATTAGEFQDLLSASRNYTSANYAALTAQVPVGGTTEIPLSSLNLLPNFSGQNPYGQTWHVYMQQSGTGQITALVLTSGGTALPLPSLTNIASLSGNHGGYVGQDNVVPGMTSQMAIGAGGGWRLPLAGMPNPGSGHLYGLATGAAGAQYNSDALYRDAVPNHPELNGMHAPLAMNGNDITSIGNAQVQNDVTVGNQLSAHSAKLDAGNSLQIGAASMYGDSQNAAIRAPGQLFVQHPDGSLAPVSAGSLTLPAGNNLTEGSGSFYADDNNAAVRTPGQVYMQHQDGSLAPLAASTITASNAVQLSANATAGAGCSNNGLISASSDGSGTTLNCVNGRWSILGATFNNGSWVSGTLALNATSGPFTNNAITPAAVNVICPNRVHDLQIRIQMDGIIIWDSGTYVGSGYNSNQSAEVIIPPGKSYYVIPTGFPGEDGGCYIAARW